MNAALRRSPLCQYSLLFSSVLLQMALLRHRLHIANITDGFPLYHFFAVSPVRLPTDAPGLDFGSGLVILTPENFRLNLSRCRVTPFKEGSNCHIKLKTSSTPQYCAFILLRELPGYILLRRNKQSLSWFWNKIFQT